jgi:FkbM family methyltransferase
MFHRDEVKWVSLAVRYPWKLIPLFLRSKPNQPQLLELPQKGLTMWVRSRMDAWSVKEAMLDRFYERYGTQIQADWTVVDVGAAIGEFTILAAKEAPRGRVFAIEPNPGSVKLLKRNLEVNEINNVEIVQKGFWRESSLQTLDLLNNEPLQAVTQNSDQVQPGQIQFATQTLANFMSQHRLKRIDLLKSDAEGAEYDFLLTSSADVLSLIERIVMEYHDLDEERNHRVLSEFLTVNGYKVRLSPNQVHPNIGYLYAEFKGLE